MGLCARSTKIAKAPIVGADPKGAFAIFVDRAHKPIAQSIPQAVSMKSTRLVAQQTAAFSANPQAAIPGGQQREDAILFELGGVLVIEDRESRAIEAQQAACGSNPQAVVRSLRKGLHGLFRQTVLRLP